MLWDSATHRQLGPPLLGLQIVNSIAFSPNGHDLAAGGAGMTVLWNLASGHPRGQRLMGEPGAVSSVAFSPNGQILATAGSDRTITLWNYRVGMRFGAALIAHTGGVDTVADPAEQVNLPAQIDRHPEIVKS